MNDKSQPFIMNQTHNRIPQKVSAKETRAGVRAMARTEGSRLLPARDGEERADARIPPKRAICRERREMEAARGQWEDEQCVHER